MSTPSIVCTFILPSRKRPEKLIRAVDSILSTSKDQSKIQIMVWIDEDDSESIKVGPRLKERQVAFFVAPRKWISRARESMSVFALGKWICMFNDDAEMQGEGWLEQLEAHEPNCIFQPEDYRLNDCHYIDSSRTGFPFFPNGCWVTFGCAGNFIPHPGDYAVCELAERHGWPIKFLRGLTIWHDRVSDATLRGE